jgi:hypothetical protein
MKWLWFIGALLWGWAELSSLFDRGQSEEEADERWFCGNCRTWNSLSAEACRFCRQLRSTASTRAGA